MTRELLEITSDDAHAQALRYIEELMEEDPQPDSDAGKELVRLVDIVEAYERQRWPLDWP